MAFYDYSDTWRQPKPISLLEFLEKEYKNDQNKWIQKVSKYILYTPLNQSLILDVYDIVDNKYIKLSLSFYFNKLLLTWFITCQNYSHQIIILNTKYIKTYKNSMLTYSIRFTLSEILNIQSLELIVLPEVSLQKMNTKIN